MNRLISSIVFFTTFSLSAQVSVSQETVFAGGTTASSESFSGTEGMLWFIAAMLGTAAVYAMILVGKTVHRNVEAELEAVARILQEKK